MLWSLPVNDSGRSAIAFRLSVCIPAGRMKMKRQKHSASSAAMITSPRRQHARQPALIYCTGASRPVYCSRDEQLLRRRLLSAVAFNGIARAWLPRRRRRRFVSSS